MLSGSSELMPAIREKIPWLREAVAQQDSDSPHTGKGNPERLGKARQGTGGCVASSFGAARTVTYRLPVLRFSKVQRLGDEV